MAHHNTDKLDRFPIAKVATIVQHGDDAGQTRMKCGAQFNVPTERGFPIAIRHGERLHQHRIEDTIDKHIKNCQVCWEHAAS